MSKSSLSILVVDDNRSAADALARVFRKQGDDVKALYDGRSAIEYIGKQDLDVVLTDLKMAPVDGMQVLRAARAKRPPIETIVFTAFGAVDIAVTAMRLGARDFLTKPVTVEQVGSRLDQLRGPGTPGSFPTIPFIAEAPSSKALLQKLRRAAGVPSSVWIQGEIGSGREFSARTLHKFGRDLTGTGAFHISNLGSSLEWPESGTVLLPNVDDLPDDLQQALHRSLQHAPPGVRLIATARRDGRQQVSEGTLRAELYYGLAVVVIEVPPLRQRREDVLPLFKQGLAAYANRYQREAPEPSHEFLERLQRNSWPGNVRELLNLAERTAVMGGDLASVDEVVEVSSEGIPALELGFSLSKWMENMERRILVEALRLCDGDRAAAGRLLGVERNTLRYKLNKYGLLDT